MLTLTSDSVKSSFEKFCNKNCCFQGSKFFFNFRDLCGGFSDQRQSLSMKNDEQLNQYFRARKSFKWHSKSLSRVPGGTQRKKLISTPDYSHQKGVHGTDDIAALVKLLWWKRPTMVKVWLLLSLVALASSNPSLVSVLTWCITETY